MKIAMMSSWNARCGIAEYSRGLVEELLKQGHDVKVICNKPHSDSLEPPQNDVGRVECFEVTLRSQKIEFDAKMALKVVDWADLLHIQFECGLYHPDWMPPFMEAVAMRKPVVVTMHSGYMWPEFPVGAVSTFIGHDKGIVAGLTSSRKPVHLISMGVKTDMLEHVKDKGYEYPDRCNTVVSFGLGRNDDDQCKQAISKLPFADVAFGTSYGDSAWVPADQLRNFLIDSGVISLMYPPVGTNVSSSAAAFALSVPVPLVVSNTNWFNWLKEKDVYGVHFAPFGDVDGLVSVFRKAMFRVGTQEVQPTFAWKRLASLKEKGLDYTTAATVPHIRVYEEVCK